MKLLRQQTNYVWILTEKKERPIQFIMPLNPEKASDIAKISPYMPCLVGRRLSKPFLFRKHCVNLITHLTLMHSA